MAYQANDGSIHASEDDAKKRNSEIANGGPTGAMSNWFVKIFLFFPALIAKVVAFVFSLIGRLGFVGKILQTAFMLVIVGPAIAMLVVVNITQMLGLGAMRDSMAFPLMLAVGIIAAAWYFLWHYYTVQQMDTSEFSDVLKNTVSFMWVGAIVAVIIGFFKGSGGVRNFLMAAACAAGGVFYIIKTRPYAKEAAAKKSSAIPAGVKMIVMLAAVGVAVALTAIGGIAQAAEIARSNAERAQREAAYEARITEAAKENPALLLALRETPFEATLTAETQGTIVGPNQSPVTIHAGSAITVINFSVDENLNCTIRITVDGKEMIIKQLDAIQPVE